MSHRRRSWHTDRDATEGGGEHYLSISDLMAGLLAIFILLVVVFMARLASSTAQAEQARAEAEQAEIEATHDKKRIKALEAELAQKVNSRRVVLGHLMEALKANNIDVEVNLETGDVTIRESMLFGFNSAELGPGGQRYIANFVPTYANVIFSNETFVQSIHRIVVEGHTSRNGGDLHNMKLSMERARAVADHIRTGVDFPKKDQLFNKLVAAGRGEVEANQEEEQESDRKVIFRFEFTNDQFLASIREGLKDLERVQPKGGDR